MEINFKYMKLWKNYGIKSVFFCLVTIILAGCGTRNTGKSRIEIKHDTLKVNNSYELAQNSTFNDIFSVKPIDNTKPIIINGISYYNASILFDKSIKNGIEIKGSENLSYSGGSGVVKTKNTEKKDNTILWIGVSSVVVLFIFLWFYLPKLKIN